MVHCPDGEPFFSLGLNHIDPASLRYPENIHIWQTRYGGSTTRWIRESVVPNLTRWGFNTVGWVQEVTVRHWQHSRPFTNDEYRALAMPYCHLLPFREYPTSGSSTPATLTSAVRSGPSGLTTLPGRIAPNCAKTAT